MCVVPAEMPALKVLRRKTCATSGDKHTAGEKPLSGAKIVGCTHVTAQSAVSPGGVVSHCTGQRYGLWVWLVTAQVSDMAWVCG